MNSSQDSKADWGASYKLTAAKKWKAKNAAMGRDSTDALVDYARPQAGMKVLDLASGTGEPSISLATRVGPEGQVTALDLSAERCRWQRSAPGIEVSEISPPSRRMRKSFPFQIRASTW